MHLPNLIPRAAPTHQTVPGVYGHSSASPDPGIVAGIVLGIVFAFLFIIFSIYCLINREYAVAARSYAGSSVMTMSRPSHTNLHHTASARRSRSNHSYHHARTDSESHFRAARKPSHVRSSYNTAHASRDERISMTGVRGHRVPPSELTTNSDIITVEEDTRAGRRRPRRKPVPMSMPPPPRVVEEDVVDSELTASEDEEIIVQESAPVPPRAPRYPPESRRSQSRHSDYSNVSGSPTGYEARAGRRRSRSRPRV